LGKKLENDEEPISRDILDLRNHIVSVQSRVDISLVAMSKSLAVQATAISDIAVKMENIENLVKDQLQWARTEMNLPDPLQTPLLSKEEMEWMNGLLETQEPGISPDITCYEII